MTLTPRPTVDLTANDRRFKAATFLVGNRVAHLYHVKERFGKSLDVELTTPRGGIACLTLIADTDTAIGKVRSWLEDGC